MPDPLRNADTPTYAPLQARIAGVALITTVIALVAACACFMVQQWSVARQEARANHQVLTQMIAAGAAAPLAAGDVAGVRSALEAVVKAPHVAGVQISDLQGRIVARLGDSPRGEAIGKPTQTVEKKILLDGRPIGSLSLVAREPRLEQILARDLALTGTLFFGSAGLAILLANSLARRMTQPMQRLTEAMQAVAADGHFRPVEQTSKDDVFQSLTESFNQLVGRLEINDQDLRGAMAELVTARDEANAANVLKSHFLANMSHEIRTPLNGVLAMAEVMAMDDLKPAQRERLAVIRDSGGLLLAVLNDVLDLSKIEAGRLDLAAENFDLATLAAALRDSFVGEARDKGLAFEVAVAAEAQGVWLGDVDRLRQILGNLISNALKFTLNGAVAVRFASAEDGSGLRIDVADTGIGISADIQPRLFDKFVQADSSTTRQFGGSGLGLAICRELATLMGGGIAVQSREGQGSTFTVVLAMPRGGEMALAAEVVEEARPTARTRPRVLAADDNPTNQRVITAVLAPLGAEVELVADGVACIEAWKRGGHDIILMDIHMPIMDGVEAAKIIRELERAEGRARTPIVAVTANALAHQVEGYLAAGMDGHVAKPIEVTKLYAAIEAAMTAASLADAA
ncbi:ATP-binding protein [Caulobacter sp. DWR1-3-2b1]|uniref:ATP-binding protein n=1 Tax=Caulobacter sp. DWR1-3-2b1 TaxID=2804670 RepID=UPI003CF86C7B